MVTRANSLEAQHDENGIFVDNTFHPRSAFPADVPVDTNPLRRIRPWLKSTADFIFIG